MLSYLYKNYAQIKSVFMYYAAISSYPTVTYEKFLECLEECSIFDGDFKKGDAFKVFILAKGSEEAPETLQYFLKRSEFIEVFIRIAVIKATFKRVEINCETVGKCFGVSLVLMLG